MKLTLSNDASRTRFACVACAVALALSAVSCASPDRAEDTVDVRDDEVVTSDMLREQADERVSEEMIDANDAGLEKLSELGYVGGEATEASNSTMEEAALTWASFGGGVQGTESVPVAQVFERAQALNGQRMILEGDVESVCLTKGCWMYMTDGQEKMLVRFKDYGFFVPMDIAGKTARVEGVFSMQEISVADQKHYLMDENKPEEAARITAPAMKYTFMADGAAIGS